MLCLWHVILDHEHGLVGCTRVAAKEPGVVCTRIVVFIQLEAQAEPGGAGQVDGGECTAPKDDRVPAGTGGRTEYSNIALNYLLNDADINFLANQHFTDGTPLFNSRELSHMVDVKNVVKPSLTIGYLACGLFVLIGIVLYLSKSIPLLIKGIRLGAWVLLGLIASIGIFALVSFWNFFAAFHSLFFQGESWIFSYSDTLIRLFPLRFWQDAFILEGIIVVGLSTLILVLTRPKQKEPA